MKKLTAKKMRDSTRASTWFRNEKWFWSRRKFYRKKRSSMRRSINHLEITVMLTSVSFFPKSLNFRS